MNITLWKKEVRHDDGRINDYRHVTASMTDANQLVIFCCDINRTAEAMWGDTGVEFELVVGEEDRTKLYDVLQVPQREEQATRCALRPVWRVRRCFRNYYGLFQKQRDRVYL